MLYEGISNKLIYDSIFHIYDINNKYKKILCRDITNTPGYMEHIILFHTTKTFQNTT